VRTFLSRAAKWVLYPAFYGFAFVVCFYLTFPWDSLKNRLITEFAKTQAVKGDKAWRLEIGSMSGYWFTGVELSDARIIMPASDDAADPSKTAASTVSAPSLGPQGGDDPPGAASSSSSKKDSSKPAAPTESVVSIPKAHARLRLLPLLIGRLRLDFEVDAFGGDVKGTVPINGGTLDVQIENVDLGQVAPIRDLVSLPLKGVANGQLELTSDAAGKWAKSNGSLELKIADVVLGDGKAKFMNQATLPPAQLGNFEISGKTTDGLLKIDKFGASGKDVTVVGQGSLKLRDPWDTSQLDLVLRFGFSDAYKVKDDKTIALFGDPKDPTSLPLVDFNPKMKQAKRPDGLWGFRGKGPLKQLQWTPTKDDGPTKPPGQPADGDADAIPPQPTAPTLQLPPRPMGLQPQMGHAGKRVDSPPNLAPQPPQPGGPDQALVPVPESPNGQEPPPPQFQSPPMPPPQIQAPQIAPNAIFPTPLPAPPEDQQQQPPPAPPPP
jgi:type II secretion system protein N